MAQTAWCRRLLQLEWLITLFGIAQAFTLGFNLFEMLILLVFAALILFAQTLNSIALIGQLQLYIVNSRLFCV